VDKRPVEPAPAPVNNTTTSNITNVSTNNFYETANEETLQDLIDEGVPSLAVGDTVTPSTNAGHQGTWSLGNLVATLLGIVLVLARLVMAAVVGGSRRRENEFDPASGSARSQGRSTAMPAVLSLTLQVAAILIAMGLMVLFLTTSDLRSLMVLGNEWTPWLSLLLLAEIVILVADVCLSRRNRHEGAPDNDGDDDDDDGGARASMTPTL
jgi:uncharacterized membrane protein